MSKRGKKSKKTGSSYHRNRKALTADRYGQFSNGKQLTADVIAGRRAGKGSDGDDAEDG